METTGVFSPGFASVGAVRRFVRAALLDWGIEECEPEMSLLATELTTNTVIHARSEFSVTVSLLGGMLRLSVRDSSPRLPVPKSHSARATTGRGLEIVEALADRWGVEVGEGGKTVWCTLAVAASTSDTSRATATSEPPGEAARRSAAGTGASVAGLPVDRRRRRPSSGSGRGVSASGPLPPARGPSEHRAA